MLAARRALPGRALRPLAAALSSAGGELAVEARAMRPGDVMMGVPWLSPVPGLPDSLDNDPGQEHANAVIAAALAAGVRHFDTAPLYGMGCSEEVFGAALVAARAHGVDGAAEAQVYTKVGRLIRDAEGQRMRPGWDQPGATPLEDRTITNDYSAAGVDASLEESLERLGVEAVHTLRVHDPNDNSDKPGKGRDGDEGDDEVAIAAGPGGACERLGELREAGTLDAVSLGMNSNKHDHQGVPEEIVRLIRTAAPGTFDSALLAGGWNLLTQAGLPCLQQCEESGVAVHVAGVFATGVLAGGDTYAYQLAPEEMLEKKRGWEQLCQDHSLSLPALAIAFATYPACVSKLVLGIATEAELEQNLAAMEEAGRVPTVVWEQAKERGLLEGHIPTPAG